MGSHSPLSSLTLPRADLPALTTPSSTAYSVGTPPDRARECPPEKVSQQICSTMIPPITTASAASRLQTEPSAARSSSTRRPTLSSPQSRLASAAPAPTVSPSSCTMPIPQTCSLRRALPISVSSGPMAGTLCRSLASTTTRLSFRVSPASTASSLACAASSLATSLAPAKSKSRSRTPTKTTTVSTTDYNRSNCTRQRCQLYTRLTSTNLFR